MALVLSILALMIVLPSFPKTEHKGENFSSNIDSPRSKYIKEWRQTLGKEREEIRHSRQRRRRIRKSLETLRSIRSPEEKEQAAKRHEEGEEELLMLAYFVSLFETSDEPRKNERALKRKTDEEMLELPNLKGMTGMYKEEILCLKELLDVEGSEIKKDQTMARLERGFWMYNSSGLMSLKGHCVGCSTP
eukprot:Nk52_evm14s2449 gene=Nk52_evmTU14s2449